MKYVITWTDRPGGSAADNEEAVRRSLTVFAKWSQPPTAVFHQFVGRLDGTGGFAVVETDDPNDVMDGPAKFGPYFDFQVYPVVDIGDAARVSQQGVEFRSSIT